MVDQNGLRMVHWGCEMAGAATWYADSETSDSHPRGQLTCTDNGHTVPFFAILIHSEGSLVLAAQRFFAVAQDDT